MRGVMMCDVSEQTFGQRVAHQREKLGLSARKAAQLAGVAETTWRNIERGRESRAGVDRDSPRPPQRLTVRRIAKLLGWSAADALRWAGHTVAAVDDVEDELAGPPNPLARIQVAWPKVPPHQQELAAQLVESMADPRTPNLRAVPDLQGGAAKSDAVVQPVTPGSGATRQGKPRAKRSPRKKT